MSHEVDLEIEIANLGRQAWLQEELGAAILIDRLVGLGVRGDDMVVPLGHHPRVEVRLVIEQLRGGPPALTGAVPGKWASSATSA